MSTGNRMHDSAYVYLMSNKQCKIRLNTRFHIKSKVPNRNKFIARCEYDFLFIHQCL